MIESKKQVLTPKDVEDEYNIPRSTQAKGRMSGDFAPFLKMNRSVRYRRSDIETWLTSKTARSTADYTEKARAAAGGRDAAKRGA